MKKKGVFVCDYCGKMLAKFEEDIKFAVYGMQFCDDNCARGYRHHYVMECDDECKMCEGAKNG